MATQVATPCRGSNGRPIGHGAERVWTQERKGKSAVGTQKPTRVKKKTDDNSFLPYLCTLICDHQLGIAINLVLLLFLTHIFFPRARRRTSKFLSFSYYNPATHQYGCGSDDLHIVALWIVIFTGLRVATMDYVLGPLARLCGIKTTKGTVRFQEQGWLVCYYIFACSLGVYIIYNSEYWFNLHAMWKGWPFREISFLSKVYYLVQWAFYIQQLIVVNIEEKRKDYAQMFTHHIFTTALLYLSYGSYQTRVGTVILCIMDLIDIVLPTAKLLKYVGFTNACDYMFGLFVVTWVVTRQIFYPMVCWSIYAHTPTDLMAGCYFKAPSTTSPNPNSTFVPATQSAEFDALGGNAIWPNLLKAYTDRDGPVCWNPSIRYSFLVLLLALQGIICLWFAMIAKVVYKVISGQGADDVRSDDEGDDEEMADDTAATASHAAKTVTEQEVGVEALSFASRKSANGAVGVGVSRMGRRSTSRASGISIPGHGDRKELLGRIGCDKPS